VHSVVYISDEKDNLDLVFSKNGDSKKLPYVIQTREWIEKELYFKNNQNYIMTVLRKSKINTEMIDLLVEPPIPMNSYAYLSKTETNK